MLKATVSMTSRWFERGNIDCLTVTCSMNFRECLMMILGIYDRKLLAFIDVRNEKGVEATLKRRFSPIDYLPVMIPQMYLKNQEILV